jgi:hypothetical protein
VYNVGGNSRHHVASTYKKTAESCCHERLLVYISCEYNVHIYTKHNFEVLLFRLLLSRTANSISASQYSEGGIEVSESKISMVRLNGLQQPDRFNLVWLGPDSAKGRWFEGFQWAVLHCGLAQRGSSLISIKSKWAPSFLNKRQSTGAYLCATFLHGGTELDPSVKRETVTASQ